MDLTIASLITGSLYALIAVGLNIQWGVTRVLNMSHGEFIMLGAFGAYSLYVFFGISPLVSLVICSPFLFAIGILFHRFFFRHLQRTAESPEDYEINSLLAAFGLSFMIASAAALGWGTELKAYSYLTQPVNVLGALFAANRLVALLFAVVLCLIVYLFLAYTRTGKAIRAAAMDIKTSQLMGVNVDWTLALSFGIGAALAGLAGVLLSMMFTLTPFMGGSYLTITFIIVVIGGLGNILGSFLGGLILGFIGTIVTSYKPGLAMVAFFLIFVVVLLVRPSGILGKS